MQPSRSRAVPEAVSELTTARLSVYLRCLDALERAGAQSVSSRMLAEQCHLNAALIRKDLANFGAFGVRGVGYRVEDLKRHLREILGLGRSHRVVIVGAGHLGFALADYPGFRDGGFEVVAMFDVAPAKVGQRSRSGVEVQSLQDLRGLVASGQVDIAVVTVPRDAAPLVIDLLADLGVRAILNFAPGTVQVPGHVKLTNVDLGVLLESLSFFLSQNTHAETHE
jgi:redox-sensing transcriptional repressor